MNFSKSILLLVCLSAITMHAMEREQAMKFLADSNTHKPIKAKKVSLEQVGQELMAYLQTINTESVTTNKELIGHINACFNRDASPNILPLFCIYAQKNRLLRNKKTQKKLDKVLKKTLKAFIDTHALAK